MNFDWDFFFEVIRECVKVIPLTLKLTVWGFLIGIAIAAVMAILRYKKIPVLDQFFTFYISFMRGTPIMLQLYLVYYIIPAVVASAMVNLGYDFKEADIASDTLVILALALNVSAGLAETIRGALNTLGRSEIEAGYSIGMTSGMVLRRIIIPQVFVLSVPNFSNSMIGIMHATSLAFYVAIKEITGTARIMSQDNWNYYEAFLATGIIYWVLTVCIELITFAVEKISIKRGYNFKIQ